jgi:hypothetical protein
MVTCYSANFFYSIISNNLELFGNTKMDLGQCEKFHSLEFKEQFEANPAERAIYEAILERELESYVFEADKKIKVSCDVSENPI